MCSCGIFIRYNLSTFSVISRSSGLEGFIPFEPRRSQEAMRDGQAAVICQKMSPGRLARGSPRGIPAIREPSRPTHLLFLGFKRPRPFYALTTYHRHCSVFPRRFSLHTSFTLPLYLPSSDRASGGPGPATTRWSSARMRKSRCGPARSHPPCPGIARTGPGRPCSYPLSRRPRHPTYPIHFHPTPS